MTMCNCDILCNCVCFIVEQLQIRTLQPSDVASLLKKVIPEEWKLQDIVITKELSDETQPPLGWFEVVWNFLRKEYPDNLEPFHDLPILPLRMGPPLVLARLNNEKSTIILKSAFGLELQDSICSLLSTIDTYVLEFMPIFLQNHPIVQGNYIKLPMVEDIVSLMFEKQKVLGDTVFCEKLSKCQAEWKDDLVKFIGTISPKHISTLHKNFLKSLPIFRTTRCNNETIEYTSAQIINKAIAIASFPGQLENKYLDLFQEDMYPAARLLGVKILNEAEIVTENLVPQLRQSKLVGDQVQKWMFHIFDDIHTYAKQHEDFYEIFSDVPFVETCSGRLERPRALFDPTVPSLVNLFVEEDVFPVGPYATPDNLQILRKMGMRGPKAICPKDILVCLFKCEEVSIANYDQAQKKSEAILHFLNTYPQLLEVEVNGQLLIDWTRQVAWVPVHQGRLVGMPENLPWRTEKVLKRTDEVTSMKWASLVYSVYPLANCNASVQLQQLFCWDQPPNIKQVLTQLAVIVQHYSPTEKIKYLEMLLKIYEYLLCLSDTILLSEVKPHLHEWIWNGKGFCGLDKLIIQKPSIDLEPFVFSLPEELLSFQDKFMSLGVQKECDTFRLVTVLGDICKRNEATNSNQYLQLSIDILNSLANTTFELDDDIRDQILFPVQTNDQQKLLLKPFKDCTFCDVEWIRHGFDQVDFDEQDGILMVHQNVPNRTAEILQVPTLMSRMLNAEEFAITGFGQTEPLTTRLKRLLNDYTDGLALFKEMIQNADDAGATEVFFMYDERSNADAKKFLIDENMRECQGEALWVYNNATFTDTDFKNITKLGGATKECELDKIGKFGLGFNAVYNLTDVPSFISDESIVLFDPHMSHLGRGIKDRTKPGIRLDMHKNKTLLKKLPDQFKPYQDVFGCKIGNMINDKHEIEPYNGTLFRLPLRTAAQATRSYISDRHYDQTEVKTLFKLLLKNVNSLLLFTQNVKKVSLFHTDADSHPKDTKEIFTLTKQLRQTCESEGFNFLSFMTTCMSTIRDEVNTTIDTRHTIQLQTKTFLSEYGCIFLEQQEQNGIMTQDWLVSYSLGNGEAFQLALKSNNLSPVGGIAMGLQQHTDGFIPVPLEQLNIPAQVFCFMPLPVFTGLPVHINGTFSVQSNRRALAEKNVDDKSSNFLDWNVALLEDPITDAYINGLLEVRKLLPTQSQSRLDAVWPMLENIKGYYHPLVCSFLGNVFSYPDVPIIQDCNHIGTISNTLYVSFKSQEQADLARQAIEQEKNSVKVSMLPAPLLQACTQFNLLDKLWPFVYDADRFYSELFFSNLSKWDSISRDKLVAFALMDNSEHLKTLLASYPCIPSTPEGEQLKLPSDLVHPKSKAARLFTNLDSKFPHGEIFNSVSVLKGMVNVGMLTDDLPWDFLLDRAQTMRLIFKDDDKNGKDVLNMFMHFLDKKLEGAQLTQEDTEITENVSNIKLLLKETQFIPVMNKPRAFPLPWKGNEYDSNDLLAPNEVFAYDYLYLISSVCPVAFTKGWSPSVIDFLGIEEKEVSPAHALVQLEHLLLIDPQTLRDDKEFEEYQKSMHSIYSFIQKHISDPDLQRAVSDTLQNKPCVLIGKTLVEPKHVALKASNACAPYLQPVPFEIARRFKPLLEVISVKREFEIQDYIATLQAIQDTNQSKQLSGTDLKVVVNLANEISDIMKNKELTASQVEEEYGTIFIPNASGVLQHGCSLCYNDYPSLTDSASMKFTHPQVNRLVSTTLGVKTKREEVLNKYATGLAFGQKERLTNSIKRILKSYPADIEILLELVQNADDSKATKVHFIKDFRHHPTQKIFGDAWKDLQGPALCVFNDKPFNETDIEGIQLLGEGSKSRDPTKTGQYGIGFSSIYHITDVPSFITSSPDLSPTLCVFDPQCSYIPGASRAEPGMRFEELDALRAIFPDVFQCYLEDTFKVESSTVFRFPLRTKPIAERSEISKNVISEAKLDMLLHKMTDCARETLLFTNYLDTISVSEVDPENGQLKSTYCANATISHKDRQKRIDMAEIVKESSQKLKSGEWTLNDIPEKSITYTLVLNDNHGHQEKWKVVQAIGFKSNTKIPNSVSQAFESGELCLLPRGGAACMLERRLYNRPVNDVRKGRVFCFLPLPTQTSLPVDIHGHFALSYENRRELCTTPGCRLDWNNLLCESVIPRAYLDLLKSIRMHGLNTPVHDDSAHASCSRIVLNGSIKAQQSYFPHFNDTENKWDVLVKSFYDTMAYENEALLPAIKESVGKHASGEEAWDVVWLPPMGEEAFFLEVKEEATINSQASFLGRFKSFFKASSDHPQKSEEESIREILQEFGLQIIVASPEIMTTLQKCEIAVTFLSPVSVCQFLKTAPPENYFGTKGKDGIHLEESSFKNESTLRMLTQYCQKDEDFKWKLEGMPLLLTADGMLRTFDADNPVYYSSYLDLLPNENNNFMAQSIQDLYPEDIFLKEKIPHLQAFAIENLADHLANALPITEFKDQTCPNIWDKNASGIPNHRWVGRLWKYLQEKHLEIMKNETFDTETKHEHITKSLSALESWSLVPIIDSGRTYLMPLGMAESAVDILTGSSKSGSPNSTLQKLHLPEIDLSIANYASSENICLLKSLVTTTDKPVQMLKLVHERLSNPRTSRKISNHDCKMLLNYFAENLEEIRKNEENSQFLRDLPIYATIYGDIVPLSDSCVFILPSKIPKNGISEWQSQSGNVFLESNDEFNALYTFLNSEAVDITYVYCHFIFQHFEYFPVEDRSIHLHHVYKEYLNEDRMAANLVAPEERDNLLHSLKHLPFIEDGDGVLSCANEFYDPENLVFRIMVSPEKFPPPPPSPFRESEWYNFLSIVGLIKSFDRDMYLNFTKQVADQAQVCQTGTLETRSKALVQHLFEMEPNQRESVVENVVDVPFLSPHNVPRNMSALVPQYGDMGNGKLPFITFGDSVHEEHASISWSQANILPRWADPMKHNSFSSSDDRKALMHSLRIQEEPPMEVVVSHFKNLCNQSTPATSNISSRRDIFKDNYRFLEKNEIQNTVAGEELKNIPCILVNNGTSLVKPKQTVVNLYNEDEIRPYLFKMPMELGEFREWFVEMGATEMATAVQYVSVLSALKENVGNEQLLPHELSQTFKAVKGLFDSLGNNRMGSMESDELYLPSETGFLLRSTKLVFNDAPSYYERIQKFGLQFLMHPRECGVKSNNVEDLLRVLPVNKRPVPLSTLVDEELDQKCYKTATVDGIAKHLNDRLSSKLFVKAIVRLMRHENHKAGNHIDEQALFNLTDSLSMMSVCMVDRVKTHLLYKKKIIDGSEEEKVYFVKKEDGMLAGLHKRIVFIRNGTRLDQEVLVPLAEVINMILGGALRESILYLLPILSCSDSEIHKKLDTLNVRLDLAYRASGLPVLGSAVPEAMLPFTKSSHTDFTSQEYVGYRPSPADNLVYAVVQEQIIGVDDENIFIINIGNNQDAVIAKGSQLTKFSR